MTLPGPRLPFPTIPETFTHTISAEITADADGAPRDVVVHNFGGLSKDVVRAIALEAVAAWEGRCEPLYAALGWEQVSEDSVRVYIGYAPR